MMPSYQPNNKALSGVALVAGSETRLFMLEVARLLKLRHGSVLHLYCSGPQEVMFYKERDTEGLFASITDADVLLPSTLRTDLDEPSVVARARKFEARIGSTYNMLAVANRHLGRGYALGGFYHPRSRVSQNTTYLQLLHAYNETLAFWEREFREKGISLVLNGGKEAACMARALGLPCRALAGARYKNYHYWGWNEFNENPSIEIAYHNGVSVPVEGLNEPYLAHRVNRSRFLGESGFASMVKKLLMATARHSYWYVRGYKKAKGYYLRENLKYYMRQWREYNRLRKLARVKLADLKGQSFVFYPLHLEPEAALQILSPEYFYQLSSIAAISRDLPAGTLLAIKEAFGAIGRRPANFYDQIAELKNVVMLDTMELGLDVVREARAVATINGTAGFEAAVMGKPVIAFGRHNTYNFLPHVRVVTHEAKLKKYLHDALNGGIDEETARKDGLRFLQAVVASSFDMRNYDYVKLREFERQTVEDAYQSLLRSLQDRLVSVMSNPAANNFAFGTKGETLERLRPLLTIPHLCDQLIFNVSDWRRDPSVITDRILKEIKSKRLVVRSSAVGEDGWNSSMAGAYLSLTGVEPNNESVAKAVDQVIGSYGDCRDGDQVLVQPMIGDVVIAGVVLTRELDTGSPYYVINYDDSSGRTDSVTSGAESKTMLVHRSCPHALHSPRLRRLIESVIEIEAATNCYELDIEFCITAGGEIYVLQVRPLAVKRSWRIVNDDILDKALDQIRSTLGQRMQRQDDLAGPTTIFGEMPDWNPAEMIGNTPKPLALSLYKYLITDSAWCEARCQAGYRKLRNQPLLVDFAGRPFIDVRRSLNSFLPDGLEDGFSDRLIGYQLSQLSEHRDYHDKIEFKIAVSCRDFTFNSRANELRGAGFTPSEIEQFGGKLKELTGRMLTASYGGLDHLLDCTQHLHEQRQNISGLPPRVLACRLLAQAIPYGTLPFAVLARHAFVGMSFLRSMVEREVLGQDEYNLFLRSIHTVASEIVQDMHALSDGAISRSDFLKRYGHLRPGTYDILSWRYDEQPDLYLGCSERAVVPRESFALTARAKRLAGSLIAEEGHEIAPEDLFNYISKAIRFREKAKFEFSRNISDALAALCLWGEEVGLSREDIAYLSIEDIRGSKDVFALKDSIEKARRDYSVTRAIRLPHLILAPDDIDIVRMPLGKPTFITSKSVIAESKVLHANEAPSLDHKIVLVESADPGFDWVFMHPIAGLITKFGGANSHMAIRCAEFGLPAAIGCGERMFEGLAKGRIIELNCGSGTVRVVSS